MAEARRYQLRFSMLPHIGGKKFDAEEFLKMGVVNEFKYHSAPMTPAMLKAMADIEAERRMHEERKHGSGI